MTGGSVEADSGWIRSTRAAWFTAWLMASGPLIVLLFGTFLLSMAGGVAVFGGLGGTVGVFLGLIAFAECTGLYTLERTRLRGVRRIDTGVEILTFLGRRIRIPAGGFSTFDGKRGWGVLHVQLPRPRDWALEPEQYKGLRGFA